MKYNPSFNKDLNRNTWDFNQVNTVTSDTPKEKICNSFCYWPRLVFFVDAKELDAKCTWFSIGCTLWCLKKMKRKFKIIFRSQEVEKDVTPSVVSVGQGRKPNPQRKISRVPLKYLAGSWRAGGQNWSPGCVWKYRTQTFGYRALMLYHRALSREYVHMWHAYPAYCYDQKFAGCF